jgi:hypothetical protein
MPKHMGLAVKVRKRNTKVARRGRRGDARSDLSLVVTSVCPFELKLHRPPQ